MQSVQAMNYSPTQLSSQAPNQSFSLGAYPQSSILAPSSTSTANSIQSFSNIETSLSTIKQMLALIINKLGLGSQETQATNQSTQVSANSTLAEQTSESGNFFSSALNSVSNYLKDSDAVNQTLNTIGSVIPGLGWMANNESLISGANAVGTMIGWFL